MAADLTPSSIPAGQRGALRIADRVVTKIAARAAGEALTDTPADASVPAGRMPRAAVSVRGDTASVRLSVDLGYPADLGRVCGSVCRHVTARTEELTGIRVPEITIEVERLHSAGTRKEKQSGGRVT